MTNKYYVARFQGNIPKLNDLLTSLAREVNLYIAYGATVTGGVNICYAGTKIIVSQALLLR
jgi:hypothetical protein